MRAIAVKVLKPPQSVGPEKVEIYIPDAEQLFSEIRVPNALTDSKGNTLALQPGTEVDLILGAGRQSLVGKETNP